MNIAANDVLNGAADGWKQAAAKVARLNDDITDLNLSVDDRWTGRAAEQYKQSIEQCKKVVRDHPDLRVARDYDELRGMFAEALG